MKNRLFVLPKDVFNTSVLNNLPTIKDRKQALVAQSATLEEAQQRYKTHFERACSSGADMLHFIAGLDRADIAWFLQQHIGGDSILQTTIHNNAKNSAADFALYALLSNVESLDIERLNTVTKELQAQGCPARILNSLAVICAYRKREGLAECLREDVAYVNLCGAILEGDLQGVDLSYADLTGAMFNLACTGCNLESANFTGANLMSDARFESCTTTKLNVTDARVAMGFVFESTEQPGGTRRFDVPELEPLILRQRVNIGSSTNIDRRQNGCSVM